MGFIAFITFDLLFLSDVVEKNCLVSCVTKILHYILQMGSTEITKEFN